MVSSLLYFSIFPWFFYFSYTKSLFPSFPPTKRLILGRRLLSFSSFSGRDRQAERERVTKCWFIVMCNLLPDKTNRLLCSKTEKHANAFSCTCSCNLCPVCLLSLFLCVFLQHYHLFPSFDVFQCIFFGSIISCCSFSCFTESMMMMVMIMKLGLWALGQK